MGSSVLRSFSMRMKDVKEGGAGFGLKWKGMYGTEKCAAGASANSTAPVDLQERTPQTTATIETPSGELCPSTGRTKCSGGGLLGLRRTSMKGSASNNRKGWQFSTTKLHVNLANSDDPATALVSPFPEVQSTEVQAFSNPALSYSHSNTSSPSLESLDSELAAKEQELAAMKKQKEEAEASHKAMEEKWRAEAEGALAKVEEMKKEKEHLEARLAAKKQIYQQGGEVTEPQTSGDAVRVEASASASEVQEPLWMTEVLVSELARLKLLLEKKTNDCEDLEKQLQSLTTEESGLASQVQELKEKLKDAEAKATALQREMSALEVEMLRRRSASGEDGSPVDVEVFSAEKAVLEEKLKQVTATAEAAALASLMMQNERKVHFVVEENLRKELGAAGLQISQLKKAKVLLEQQVALLNRELDNVRYELRWGNQKIAGVKEVEERENGGTPSELSMRTQVERMKSEKEAIENELRKELDAAAVQLNHVLTEKAVLEDKLQIEMKMNVEMWKTELKSLTS